MATLSTVAVDFIANVSKYISGLTRMKEENKKFSSDTKKEFSKAKGGIDDFSNGLGGGLKGLRLFGAALGGIGLASFARDVLNTAEKIGDLSDQLSISGVSLQKLQGIFAKSGASVDDVVASISKLEKSAVEAAEGNKSLEQSFARLGINADSFNKLNADDKVVAFAKALQTIKDPAEKASLAQEILGKSSRKVLQGFKDIAESGDINKAAKEVVTFSDEAGAAVSEFADNAKLAFANFNAIVIELIGNLLISQKELKKLQDTKGPAGIPTTAGAFLGQGGFGTTSNVAAAVEQARGSFDKTDLQLAREEQGLLRERAKQDRERAAALELQAEAFRKVRDSILATIDPVAKYSSEVDKINEVVKKNKLSEEDRLKLIAGISQAYIFAVDPVKKYAAEVAKIKADKGLSEKQKADNIKLLGAAYDDAIDPANRYKKILEDLDALVANGIRTDQERRTVIDSLGSSYRALYDPTEKYLKLQRDLIALPRGSNVNILDVLRNSNKEVRDILRPLAELDDKLKESNAYFEALANTEVATLQKILNGYQQQGTLTQGRLELLQQERDAIQAKYQTEATFAALTIKQQKDAIYQRELAIALNDKQLLGEAQYTEELVRINKLLAASRESEKGAMRLALTDQQKRIMLTQAEAKVFLTRNETIAQGFQYMSDFADQFSRAIAAGENFGDALSNVFKNILRDITAMILRTMILQGIMAAIGFINPVAGAAFGTMVGLPPGRAGGGPVMAGMPYTVGEQGPEMFVPRENGYIVPNDMMPGESMNVTQNIYIETGVSQTVRAEMVSLLPKFRQEAIASVLDAKLRGGSYAKGLVAA
jgi:hypothetical protein